MIFLELFSALHARKMGTIAEWFGMFGRQQESYISFIEFKTSLEKLDVKCS